MKKTFKALFSIFALFSLIACGDKPSKSEISSSSNKSIESTNSQQSSSVEESSSSYEVITSLSSGDADEDWSIDESSTTEYESTSSESSSEISASSSLDGTYYHVTFVNYDDSVLYEIDVLEGEEAVYSGDTPTKKADDDFEYEFDGWDEDLSSITSNVTAKAQYKSVPKKDWGPIIWF